MAKIREPVGTPGHTVKNLPQSEIQKTIEIFNFKTKPRDHQQRALYLGIDEDTFLYALDMGLGKTLLGLYLTIISEKLDGKSRTLVTCPPIVLGQWKKEVAKHTDLSVQIVDGKNETAKIMQLHSSAEIIAVSHSWLTTLFSKAAKVRALSEEITPIFHNFDLLIVDEAHVLRNPATKGFTGYKKYLLNIKKRYLLTGTPSGNNYTGIWSLYYILDEGDTFGVSYAAFLTKYFTAEDSGNYIKYRIRPANKMELMRKFWTKAVRWEEGECNDLPSKSYTTLSVTLTPEQNRAYDSLLPSVSYQHGDETEDPVFALMKITAGIGMKKSPKLDALIEIVDDVCIRNNRQFIIWSWLREEADYLLHNLSKKFKSLNIATVNGSGTRKTKDSVLDAWAKSEVDIIIANQKSLGIGVDLYEANKCCFFSNNRSLTDRKQSEKRIHRTGQTLPCTYIDLVCSDTIDEINLHIVNSAYKGFTELTKDSDVIELTRRQRL